MSVDEVSVREIAEFIGKEAIVIGDPDRTVFEVGPIDTVRRDVLSFYYQDNARVVGESLAKVVICRKEHIHPGMDRTYIIVENPRLWFIRCCWKFFPPKDPSGLFSGYPASTDIHYSAQINECIVTLGERVRIGPNSSIGWSGFGFERGPDGKWERFPHYGGVTIEDDVEVGKNVCIDRGTFGDTVVGEGTKVDNLVHIAHNVQLGRNCIVVAHALIAGSARVGDGVWVGPHAVIRDGVTVGEGALIGMGAVVTKDVEPYSVMAGVPARKIRMVK